MKKYIPLLFSLFFMHEAVGQLSPLKGQYYENPYQSNPAMAGHSGSMEAYANYSNQWNRIAGAPVMMSLSLSGPIKGNASFGINLNNDKAGLIAKTQVMGTFAYKVPLTEEQNLRFGVSLSWSQDRLDYGMATSSGINDVELAGYNDRENYLDGNVGVTYQYKKLEAQFSYLSLNEKRYSRISTVDYSTFYSSVSYQIEFDNSFGVKPLLAYRGIKNFDNQLDIAAEWKADMLRFYTMYHSNNSFTGGMGYVDKGGLRISALYNSEPVNLRGFSGGIFDIVLGYRFGK
ncbi:PorP/SprF family type IX secretion system membrane protein [Pseudopedobacter beijingensis]|uniref:PorP/SprF family type IX secretion system membrane protein n=1 Tax=Pseudopedobacter beijingensis TaxID=1207056 RepID=A0ABW4IHP7_9SPHI